MRKVLRVFGLLMAATVLSCIVGCDSRDYEQERLNRIGCGDGIDNVPPTVTFSPSGGDIGSNTIVTATFSKALNEMTVTSDTWGPIMLSSIDNKWLVFTFTIPKGDNQVVTVDFHVECGVSGSASATFNVGEPDIIPPEVDDNAFAPNDGDTRD